MSSSYASRTLVHGPASAIACATIAGVAVILRFITRFKTRASIGWDDYFSAIASISLFCTMGTEVWGYSKGKWADDPATLPIPQLQIWIKALFITSLLVVVTIAFAKLSIICLLRRIFGVNRSFRICVDVLAAYVLATSIATFFTLLFQCRPVKAGWDPLVKYTEPTSCIDSATAACVTAVLDASSEILMIVLPITAIRKLHLPLRQRIAISFVFALGFVTAATAVIRASESYWPGASSADLASSALWINIQLGAAIVVGCLPVCRRFFPSKLGSWLSYLRRSSRQPSKQSDNHLHPVERDKSREEKTDTLSDSQSQHGLVIGISHVTNIERSDSHTTYGGNAVLPDNRIHVKQVVNVV